MTQKIDLEGIAPIHSEEAEKQVLATCLFDTDILDLAQERLVPDDFLNPYHKIVFQALVDMRRNGEVIDAVIVGQYLTDRKLVSHIHPMALISELMGSAALSSLSAPQRIETVRGKSILRQVQQLSARAIYSARELEHDPDAVVAKLERDILAISDRQSNKGDGDGWLSSRESANLAVGEIEDSVKRKLNGEGVEYPTGLPTLDFLTTGPRKGELWYVGARPGVGKSAFAWFLARSALSVSRRTSIIPLEMTVAQYFLRALSAETGINMQKFRTGELKESELHRMVMAAEEMAKWPIMVNRDFNAKNLHIFRSKARNAVLKHKSDCVMVDYIQLMRDTTQKYGNREGELAQISNSMKSIALELNTRMIGMAQLNRIPPNVEPSLINLRESGSLEQDADVILFLHPTNDETEEEKRNYEKRVRIIVAKQRNGPTGVIDTIYEGRFCRFREIPNPAK